MLNQIDLDTLIMRLRQELEQVDQSIAALERFALTALVPPSTTSDSPLPTRRSANSTRASRTRHTSRNGCRTRS